MLEGISQNLPQREDSNLALYL